MLVVINRLTHFVLYPVKSKKFKIIREALMDRWIMLMGKPKVIMLDKAFNHDMAEKWAQQMDITLRFCGARSTWVSKFAPC